ncbi:hypothetical protein [Streptomyces violaceus]|uniref:Cyclic nucleotide-binding domain-containing protein n=1 Tax=Streptomyces violaceus TaxID=1936 RepID=A0ABY9U7H8_STRVL|nr:hypothetical protein [Streptomyces janthinus]WND18812.1 hypothetical protein RI060_16320 [Streptomyces janthinus]GGS87521.1 hypothetical protein GCM10010270_69480 [Streptomyces janthinus]
MIPSGEGETDAPKQVFACSVFGPLGGVVEIGALRAARTWLLADVSVAEFLTPRQDDLRRLMEGIRVVGRFSDEVMEIADELRLLHRRSG